MKVQVEFEFDDDELMRDVVFNLQRELERAITEAVKKTPEFQKKLGQRIENARQQLRDLNDYMEKHRDPTP